jgi:hypothetical protein
LGSSLDVLSIHHAAIISKSPQTAMLARL